MIFFKDDLYIDHVALTKLADEFKIANRKIAEFVKKNKGAYYGFVPVVRLVDDMKISGYIFDLIKNGFNKGSNPYSYTIHAYVIVFKTSGEFLEDSVDDSTIDVYKKTIKGRTSTELIK